MQLGMIGLGRMGGNMAKRLAASGHEMKTYDPVVESTAGTIADLRDQLDAPRAFWLMVPSGAITEQTFQDVLAAAPISNHRDDKGLQFGLVAKKEFGEGIGLVIRCVHIRRPLLTVVEFMAANIYLSAVKADTNL